MEISFLLRVLQQPAQIHHSEAIRGGLPWSLAMFCASSVGCQARCLQTLLPAVEVLNKTDRVPGLGAGHVRFWFFPGRLCTGVCSASSSEPILSEHSASLLAKLSLSRISLTRSDGPFPAQPIKTANKGQSTNLRELLRV